MIGTSRERVNAPSAGWRITTLTLALCFVGVDARSDELAAQRIISIRVFTSHASLTLQHEERDAERAAKLLERYDRNDDGVVDEDETARAKRPALRHVFRGLDVSYSGALSAPKDPQLRFSKNDAGDVTISTHQRVDFVAKGDEFSVDVSVSRRAAMAPTRVKVETVRDWTLADGTTRDDRTIEGGATERFFLKRIAHQRPRRVGDGGRRWAPPDSTRP